MTIPCKIANAYIPKFIIFRETLPHLHNNHENVLCSTVYNGKKWIEKKFCLSLGKQINTAHYSHAMKYHTLVLKARVTFINMDKSKKQILRGKVGTKG